MATSPPPRPDPAELIGSAAEQLEQEPSDPDSVRALEHLAAMASLRARAQRRRQAAEQQIPEHGG